VSRIPQYSILLTVLAAFTLGCSPGGEPEMSAPATPSPDTAAPVAEKADLPVLVKAGESAYTIVLASSASPSERFAAEELRSSFKDSTGAELAVAEQAPSDGTPTIVIGCGAAAKALGVDPGADELGEQGYVIRTVAPHVVIAGTPQVGTLYGVYDFIESQLGVRWYAPGATKTPSHDVLSLPELDKTVRPAFSWRHTSYLWPGHDDAFMARQRDNDGKGGADRPEGIEYRHDGRCHSYFRFVSPGEYFDEHPEYFSEIGGVRRRDETQLCLTNPDVLEIVTERMLKRMEDDPISTQHNFSQMDYYSYCECEACTRINDQYGTLGGTQYWFLNQLAERTAKVFPEKQIGTLAYMYTEEPPKDLVLHPNIAVWLCHMYPSCQSHPIATCELNADYKRRALAWSKQCSHLYLWHYIIDFAHYYNPYPNLRAMAADVRFYRDIGAEGIYLQGMSGGGGGGEFSLLRAYYGMKLLWDPDLDAEAVLCDFLEGYYGAAWEPIHKYVSLIHDKVTDDDIHMHLYTNPAQGYLPDAVLQEAMNLFDEAEALVKEDEELLERVRVARMPLTYARVFPRNGYAIESDALRFLGEFAQMPETQAFIERMKQHGFKEIRESGGDPQELVMWTMAGSFPLPVATISNEHLSVDVVPVLGGRALRIIDIASGECVTAHNTVANLMFPFVGGDETRVGGVFVNTLEGPMTQFSVIEQGDHSVTLEATARGFTVRRVLTLAPDQPVLTVAAEVTNPTDKPMEAAVRSHLDLDLGDVATTRVAFTTRGGERVEKDMGRIIAGLREGEYYRLQDTPDGTWTLTGTKGLQVTQTFDAGQMDFTRLCAYPENLNDLEAELWCKPVVVEPGETFTFSQSIEIRPKEGG
jgi:Domain of unknown function (DUF4838)/Glycosyl hydrolase family 67 N-terminus